MNGANEVLSAPVTHAAYDRTRLQHIKTQPAHASKSTPQLAWPQSSTYTPGPKPPYNSCFDSSYIPQVMPDPSDFDIMSEKFARSPPWTLPKCEPSPPDNDSREVPLTLESPQSPDKQNINNRPRGRSVLLKKMRFAGHPAKDTPCEARAQNPLPNKNDQRTQDGGMGDSSDTIFAFSHVLFDRIFGFGAYAPQYKSPSPRGWYRAALAERYGNMPPNPI
jgi:hypothetical protein